MTIAHAEIFARLADWIPEDQVRFRDGQNGGHYVKAPTVMNRLDDVLGPANWWDEYRPIDDLTVECSLTIRLPDGSTLTKRDVGIRKPAGGGKVDAGCSWKAAYSDALKRAAVKFGVARHLCKCGFPSFVGATLGDPGPVPAPVKPTTGPDPEAHEPGPSKAHEPGPSDGRREGGERAAEGGHADTPPREGRGRWGNGRGQTSGTSGPRSGRALFAWVKEQESRHQVGLLKYLNGWAKLQEFPGRMVDFSDEQIRMAHAEAVRKLDSIPATRGDAYEEALSN